MGAPILTDAGKALGMVTYIPPQGGPGETKASDFYRVLRAQRGEGLDVTVNTLKQRFDRSTPTTTPEPPEGV